MKTLKSIFLGITLIGSSSVFAQDPAHPVPMQGKWSFTTSTGLSHLLEISGNPVNLPNTGTVSAILTPQEFKPSYGAPENGRSGNEHKLYFHLNFARVPFTQSPNFVTEGFVNQNLTWLYQDLKTEMEQNYQAHTLLKNKVEGMDITISGIAKKIAMDANFKNEIMELLKPQLQSWIERKVREEIKKGAGK